MWIQLQDCDFQKDLNFSSNHPQLLKCGAFPGLDFLKLYFVDGKGYI